MSWEGRSTFGSPIAVDVYPSNNVHGEQVRIDVNGRDVLLSPETAREMAKALNKAADEVEGN